jgi:thiamine pyrophosphate-dependent acetolactate synthase large subunit-like protein
MFGEQSRPITSQADVVLVCGTYVFPEVFPSLSGVFAPGAKVIHIDIDPTSIRKNPNVTSVESNGQTCLVEIQGSDAEVQHLLHQLVDAECGVMGFAEREPTLEDVFMMVTKGLVT